MPTYRLTVFIFCGGKSDVKPSMDINPEHNAASYTAATVPSDYTEVISDDDLPF